MMMMGIKVMMMVVAMVEIDSNNDDMWVYIFRHDFKIRSRSNQ